MKTGFLVTLPGLLGQSCHLSADYFGVLPVGIIPFSLDVFPSFEIISWAWEYDKNFDNAITHGQFGVNAIQWVDSMGNSIAVSSEMTACELMQKVTRVEQGEIIRDVNELSF